MEQVKKILKYLQGDHSDGLVAVMDAVLDVLKWGLGQFSRGTEPYPNPVPTAAVAAPDSPNDLKEQLERLLAANCPDACPEPVAYKVSLPISWDIILTLSVALLQELARLLKTRNA
jgi:hypothetical protein